MNNTKIFISTFLLLLTLNFLYSANIYKNEKHGIEFEIPEDFMYDKSDKDNINYYYSGDEKNIISGNYYLNVRIKTIKEFYEMSSFKDKDLNEKSLLRIFSKEKSSSITEEPIKYKGKIIGKKGWAIEGRDETEVNQYYIWYIIVKGEYIININLEYHDVFVKIPPRYPDYFSKDQGYFKEWIFKNKDAFHDFFNLAINHSPKAAPEIVRLYDYANIIEKSLKLYGKTYTPKITNLIFREKPDKNSKAIRIFNIDEKLELIETGKSETINGVKGNWIKVKTEKGEIGWCFDAYLKEVNRVEVNR